MTAVTNSSPPLSGEPASGERALSRSPWRPLTALAAFALIMALSVLAGSATVRLAGWLWPGYVDLAAGAGRSGAGRIELTRPALLAVIVSQVVIVALLLLASFWRGGRPATVLALRTRGLTAGRLLSTLGLFLGGAAAVSALTVSLGKGDPLGDVRPFIGLARSPDWWLLALAVVVGAPLSEELLARGFLLSSLTSAGVSFALAALATSFVWTALHFGYSAAGLAEVFGLGLLLSWTLWRTGSIWVPIVCHGLYNGLVLMTLRLMLPAAT